MNNLSGLSILLLQKKQLGCRLKFNIHGLITDQFKHITTGVKEYLMLNYIRHKISCEQL